MTLEALKARVNYIVEYNWGDELEDYESNPDPGHIFLALVDLDNWFQGTTTTAEEYLAQRYGCSQCGENSPENGDGYDGKCPSCADKSEDEGPTVFPEFHCPECNAKDERACQCVFNCEACGREESECSRNPCPDVIAEREEGLCGCGREEGHPEPCPERAE